MKSAKVTSGRHTSPVRPEMSEEELESIRNDPKYKEMLKRWKELKNERAKS